MPPKTVDSNGVQIGVIEPPRRKRARKITLSDDVLEAIATALATGGWVSNSVLYDGADGQKNAQNEARVYRRDVAGHLGAAERDVRTRVWEDNGGWRFALKRREQG